MSNHAAEQGHHNVSYDQRKDFLRMASKASSHGEVRWAHLVGTRSAETSSHSATNLLELGGRCLSSEFRNCPVLRPFRGLGAESRNSAFHKRAHSSNTDCRDDQIRTKHRPETTSVFRFRIEPKRIRRSTCNPMFSTVKHRV